MEKQKYEKPQVKDLGSIQDLTLGKGGGNSQDNIKVGPFFGTLSGQPVTRT